LDLQLNSGEPGQNQNGLSKGVLLQNQTIVASMMCSC
jgi:hypothetical protein